VALGQNNERRNGDYSYRMTQKFVLIPAIWRQWNIRTFY